MWQNKIKAFLLNQFDVENDIFLIPIASIWIL